MDLLTAFRSQMERERRHAAGTIAEYGRDVSRFLEFWDSMGRPQFDGQLVNEYLVRLWNQCGEKPATLNRKRMAIRQFYKWLSACARVTGHYDEERRIAEQLTLIDPIRDRRVVREVISSDDFKQILADCRGHTASRNRAMIFVMYSGAIRVSEMCGLNLRDLNQSSRKLRIMGKGGRERMVPISGDCLAAIQEYVEGWRTRHAKPGNPALFVSVDGERIGRHRITHLLLEISARLKLRKTTTHTLRRSRATLLMNAGQPIEKIQMFLGHQTLDATQQYLATSTDRLRDVYSRCHPRDQSNFGAQPEIDEELDAI